MGEAKRKAASKPDLTIIVTTANHANLELPGEFPNVEILVADFTESPTVPDAINRAIPLAHGDILWAVEGGTRILSGDFVEKLKSAASELPNNTGMIWANGGYPALTRQTVEGCGFIMPPWFPWGFLRAWWGQVAVVGCPSVRAEIELEIPKEPVKSCEPEFWSAVFKETRPIRAKHALELAARAYGQDSANFQAAATELNERQAKLADPNHGKLVTVPPSTLSRDYAGVRSQAEQLVNQIRVQAPKPFVAVCVPAKTTWEARTAWCVANLLTHSTKLGYNVATIAPESSMITQSRNGAVEIALKSGADYMMWIDSDHVFNSDSMDRLVRHGRDITGATYLKRTPPHPPLGKLLGNAPAPGQGLYGLHEAALLPGGFMLVKTDVYRRIGWPAYAEQYRWPGADGLDAFKNLLKDYFATVPPQEALDSLDATPLGEWLKTGYCLGDQNEPFLYWSEDLFFCRKARKHGYQIWCDMDLSHEIEHLALIGVKMERPAGSDAGRAAAAMLAAAE